MNVEAVGGTLQIVAAIEIVVSVFVPDGWIPFRQAVVAGGISWLASLCFALLPFGNVSLLKMASVRDRFPRTLLFLPDRFAPVSSTATNTNATRRVANRSSLEAYSKNQSESVRRWGFGWMDSYSLPKNLLRKILVWVGFRKRKKKIPRTGQEAVVSLLPVCRIRITITRF